ncbi:tRNA (cytosine(34)-C(5))-methyltransferase [Diplonema papillatum]|nr:tRNA (cytosine(34)-C(5))-methyltransferase [Diplonema papillatum]
MGKRETKKRKVAEGKAPKKKPDDASSDEKPRKLRDVRSNAKPNEAFLSFYHANFVDTGVMTEDEWEKFLAAMLRPLPTTFWIAKTDARAAAVKEVLHKYRREAERANAARLSQKQDGTTPEGEADGADSNVVVKPLDWVDNEDAWFIDAPRATLRKDPVFEPLHKFLIRNTERGVISRQEEASMVPVHLLDIQAESRCLDLCAAPGSKTAQMLCHLSHANYQKFGRMGVPGQPAAGGPPDGDHHRVVSRVDYTGDEGLVVANDMSAERVNILVHQIKRLAPLYPLAVFTSHDARYFPTLQHPEAKVPVPFTRVLADVMCSGDGTLRKAPHMWREWHPKHSISLHADQIRIALRAARLVSVAGRVLYSTCSLSPIENEAVVAQILLRSRGCLRLLDARKLISIRSVPGLRAWKPMCPKTKMLFATHEEALESDAATPLLPAHFPPADHLADELPKCLRLLPHLGDYGGFFVAVFEKTCDMPPRPTPSAGAEVEDDGYDSTVDEDGEVEERSQLVNKLQSAVKRWEAADNAIELAKAKAKMERVRAGGQLQAKLADYVPAVDAMPGAVANLSQSFGLTTEFPMTQMVCRLLTLPETESAQASRPGPPNTILFLAKAAADAVRFSTDPSVWYYTRRR